MKIFQAAKIAELVGMPETRISKFVESPGYGIRPTVRQKAGRGAPRLYSTEDMLKIALAWWLFQGGFRSQVIGRVLKEKAVSQLLNSSKDWQAQRYLVVKRELSADEKPQQQVQVVSKQALLGEIAATHALHVLPIGVLLESLNRRSILDELEA